MGGRVELVGKDAVRRRRRQPAIPFTLNRRAVGLNGMEDLAEQFRRRGPHDDSGARSLLAGFADLHILNVECSAHHQNRIQDLCQDQRIDDMSLEQDGFLVMHHQSDFHSYRWSAQILPPNSTAAEVDCASRLTSSHLSPLASSSSLT